MKTCELVNVISIHLYLNPLKAEARTRYMGHDVQCIF